MSTPPLPAPPRLPSRIAEWFWRGAALRAAQRQDEAERASLRYSQRARIAAEVGQRTLEPSTPWLAGDANDLASALFSESILWSLRLAAGETGTPNASSLASPAELAELVSAQQDRLLAAARDADTFSRVRQSLLERSFDARASSRQDSELAARELGDVANALLETSVVAGAATERVMLQRVARLGLLALTTMALVFGGAVLRDALERRSDLAVGKSWTASSAYETSCVSPAQECGNGKAYFFHTLEEQDPWLQLDLAKPQRVSKIRVKNRLDCCDERAVPLVVEVSADGHSWQEVARKKDTFDEWTAKFSPVSARYVRLRVPRRTLFHLKEVHLF